MKSKKDKEKALALYLDGNSMEKIAKKIGVNPSTIKEWKDKENWVEQREKAIQKSIEKSPENHQKIIDQQVEITKLANKELLRRLRKQDIAQTQIEEILGQLKEMLDMKEISKAEFLRRADELKRLYKDLIENKDLINIEKHGLEVIRPKTMAQLNYFKQENKVQLKHPDLLLELAKELENDK